MKALVVDDSRTMRLIIGRELTALGFEVVEAPDGRRALEVLREASPIGVVFSDWNMPGMNGLEFVKAARAEASFRDIPIIIVTTVTEMGAVASILEAGANEYLMKPFTREAIAEKLALLELSSPDGGPLG